MSGLSLQQVWLSYPRGRRHVVRVLENVSLELQPGEVVAVLAQRAQGKTSLLRVAAGMQRPDHGAVCLEGQDLWELSERRRSGLLSRQIGWAGPTAPDLDVPMLTHVALPLFATHGKREAYARAGDALELVGAAKCAEQLWESLADWERALVAIAHGIAREPELLLVDDLTAPLGLEEADEIAQLLSSLARERKFGVLMSVSDASATSWSGRLATLDGGKLWEVSGPSAAERDNVIDFPSFDTGDRDPMHGASS